MSKATVAGAARAGPRLGPMVACPSCGKENADDARFCSACGAPLEAEAPAREQRKTISVVFCDLTGSTAMGERLESESLRRIMARYYAAMRSELERHGGTVEKFIGDAVMAVFGVPTLREDDALRAVRAAAGMKAALAELNEELRLRGVPAQDTYRGEHRRGRGRRSLPRSRSSSVTR